MFPVHLSVLLLLFLRHAQAAVAVVQQACAAIVRGPQPKGTSSRDAKKFTGTWPNLSLHPKIWPASLAEASHHRSHSLRVPSPRPSNCRQALAAFVLLIAGLPAQRHYAEVEGPWRQRHHLLLDHSRPAIRAPCIWPELPLLQRHRTVTNLPNHASSTRYSLLRSLRSVHDC
jgi:hypothetical protein